MASGKRIGPFGEDAGAAHEQGSQAVVRALAPTLVGQAQGRKFLFKLLQRDPAVSMGTR
jgi:hypothetical protein